MGERLQWISFSYTVPAEPSRARVYVWRKVKELGALYLSPGTAILPYDSARAKDLIALANPVREFGGRALVGVLTLLTLDEELMVIEQFRRQSIEEYRRLIEQWEKALLEAKEEGGLSREMLKRLRKLQKNRQKTRERAEFLDESGLDQLEKQFTEITQSLVEGTSQLADVWQMLTGRRGEGDRSGSRGSRRAP